VLQQMRGRRATSLKLGSLLRLNKVANSLRYNRRLPMPLTVFNAEGVPANRRETIESAVEAGGKHLAVIRGLDRS
jgi:hypothetical protein